MSFLNSIATRMVMNVILALLGLAWLAWMLGNIAVDRTMEGAVAGMQNATEIAMSLLSHYDAAVTAGTLTREEAMAQATQELNAMRWAETGYLFGMDDAGRWTAHAILQDRMGQDLTELVTADGVALFDVVTDAAHGGGGQIAYAWANPATGEVEPKISYISYFEPWGWSIGTGLYESEINYADAALWRSVYLIAGGLSVALLLVVGLVSLSITRPVRAICARLQRMSEGALDDAVAQSRRKDEIGAIAREIDRFRLAQLEDRRIKAKAAADMEAEAAAQSQIVEQFSAAMTDVARGNLTVRLTQPFNGQFERLRTSFNETLEALDALVNVVGVTASAVQHQSGEIKDSAAGVSSQGQSNAASLEEAAAAIEELASSVRATSDSATELDRILGNVDTRAGESRDVVTKATDAMQRIESSSQQISKIIDVIGDIAFQTNLLALNAGVEAARAGAAGSGFAVVATEVRSLASRTSEAATEISGLIRESAEHVTSGVSLVGTAGETLGEIVEAVQELSSGVQSIAQSVRDQDGVVSQINGSMAGIDRASQEISAQFDQVYHTSTNVVDETDDLVAHITRFETSGEGQAAREEAA